MRMRVGCVCVCATAYRCAGSGSSCSFELCSLALLGVRVVQDHCPPLFWRLLIFFPTADASDVESYRTVREGCRGETKTLQQLAVLGRLNTNSRPLGYSARGALPV